MNENEGSLRRKNKANSSTLMTTNFSGKTKNSIVGNEEGEKAVTNTTTTKKKSLNDVVEEENKDEQLSESNKNNSSSNSSSAFKSFIVDAQNSFKNLTSFQEMKNNWSDYVQKTHDAQMKLLEENALKFSKDLNKMGLKVHFMPEVMKTRTEMEFRGLRKTEREAMKRFCFHTAKLVRREIQLKEAEKERRKAMEEERLTDEIVGRVNALKRKVEKEEKLRAEADEAFARTREGVDPGDATLDARASPGRDTAAYALAMRALADAIAGSAIGEDGRRAAEIALETLKMEATRALSGLAGAASTTNAARDDACDEMFLWATQRGAMFKFVANVSEGEMREARASAAVDAGDAAARVPWDALLGVEQAVLSSSAPICEVLKQLTAMGDQIIMTIWLAAAMSGQDSRLYEAWAPTLRALPRAPCTALAWDVDTMRLVMDHDQVERLIDYQRKVRVQYDALFPALCEQVPEAFPASVFGDYSRFALAYDIWTSYAMKVQDPQTLQIYEVIVPGVFLCNHALYAHSVRYTSLERGTRAFRLELARGARPGDAITISYGRLDNADLMAYYGFTLPSNPYDRVVLSSLASQANEEQTAALARASEMCGVDLTELPACIALDGSLDRVLTQMRIISAPQRFMEWCERIDGYHPYTVVDGELEYKVLCELRSHLCHLVAERQATEGSLSHRLSTVHHESTHSVANATRWYLSGQIRIMQSALARVDVLLASYGSGKRSRDEIE